MLSRATLLTFAFTIVGLNLAVIRLGTPDVALLGGAVVLLIPGLLVLGLPAGGFGQ